MIPLRCVRDRKTRGRPFGRAAVGANHRGHAGEALRLLMPFPDDHARRLDQLLLEADGLVAGAVEDVTDAFGAGLGMDGEDALLVVIGHGVGSDRGAERDGLGACDVVLVS